MELFSPSSLSSNWPTPNASAPSRTAAATGRSFLLNVARLPARVDANGAAILLGFSPHDIPVLVAAKLLLPLGRPRPSAVKYFCVYELAERAANRAWLDKATARVGDRWRQKNSRKHSAGGKRA